MSKLAEQFEKLREEVHEINLKLSNDLSHIKGRMEILFWLIAAIFASLLALVIANAIQ